MPKGGKNTGHALSCTQPVRRYQAVCVHETVLVTPHSVSGAAPLVEFVFGIAEDKSDVDFGPLSPNEQMLLPVLNREDALSFNEERTIRSDQLKVWGVMR